MIKLKVENLSFEINHKTIIKNINLTINEGEFVGIIGPNGCGKSTLLKNIYRIYNPKTGEIILNGINIKQIKNRDIAKQMAVLSQENNLEFDFTVKEMVSFGQNAVQSFFQLKDKSDEASIKEALSYVGLETFMNRSFSKLSGGEKQRVLIARALAQKSDFLVLDEPTNHLDIGYQYKILELIKAQNLTVFSAIHDLNSAAYYCDKIIVMKEGKIIEAGKPENIITSDLIKNIFQANAYIDINKVTKKLNIVYTP